VREFTRNARIRADRTESFLLHNCDRNCEVSIHFSRTPAQKIPWKSIQRVVSVTCRLTGNVGKLHSKCAIQGACNERWAGSKIFLSESVFACVWYYMCGRGSAIGTATRYKLVSPGIKTRQGRDFLHPSRQAPRSTRPPIQCVPGFSRGKAAWAWCWLPTSLQCRVVKRLEPYLHLPQAPS
jgi:hypothetical protein